MDLHTQPPFTWTQFSYLLLDSCLKARSVNPKGLWSGEYSRIEWMRVGFFIFLIFILMRMKPELKVRKTPAFPQTPLNVLICFSCNLSARNRTPSSCLPFLHTHLSSHLNWIPPVFFFSCVVHASCSNSHQRKVNDQSTHLYTWPYFTLVLNTPRPETMVKFTTAASVCLKNNLRRCGCSKNAAMNQVCLWNCWNVGRPANSGFHFFLAVSLMAMDIFMSLTLWTCTLCSFIHCIFVHVHTAHAFITLHLTLALLLISCT